jgi:cell division protein FtsI/penicillin-binding protein 2
VASGARRPYAADTDGTGGEHLLRPARGDIPGASWGGGTVEVVARPYEIELSEEGPMRTRDLLAVVVGLLVVGGIAYAGWMYLSDAIDPVAAEPEPGEEPGVTAEAYLAAWTSNELSRMASLVREAPEDFDDRHRQLTAALEPSSFEATGGELDESVDGRASMPVTVTLGLADLAEPVSWDTELVLLRDRGVWGVDWSEATIHPELRAGWGFARTSTPVEREPILASDGTALAGGESAVVFGFRPGSVTDADELVRAFAAAIPGSEAAAERELNRDDLVEDWFYGIVTVSQDRAEAASEQLRQSMGVLTRQAPGARALFDPGFARHVVGVVSDATAEQLEELGPDAEPGTQVAQFGLEAVFDDRMTGSDVVRVGLREQADDDDEDSELRVVLGEGQSDPSAPVETTIDIAVQRAIENTLVGLEDPAAIVVVDGQDGAIRGSASRPLGGFNRAFSGRYPPGSTFKLITAEALIATGVGPDDEVACPAETTVGGLRVPNSDERDFGTTTFATAFDESCNTTFATLGAQLGGEALSEAAGRFGFGIEPLVPLTAFGGSFPAPGDNAEAGAAAFGQARVETSPLHLASVAAATVSGEWHQPYLLASDGPGESRPLATGTPEMLRSLLRSAVADGTGSGADVPGQDVAGKTGTAEGEGGVEHAWFIGTWEGLGFAVLVEDGGSGGEVAAPLAGRLVEQLAGLAADDVEDPDLVPAPSEIDPDIDPPDDDPDNDDEGDEAEG